MLASWQTTGQKGLQPPRRKERQQIDHFSRARRSTVRPPEVLLTLLHPVRKHLPSPGHTIRSPLCGPCANMLSCMGMAQVLLYFASTALMALTFPADRPFGSNRAVRKASAISLANSGPITRAPIVMICALFEVAAFPAE